MNRADRRFCRSCGASLGLTCRTCGSPNEAGDRFCGSCGAALEGDDGGRAPDDVGGHDASGQPSRTGRASPETERRLVSILFADLVSFTAVAERRDPEAVREVLGRYYDVARETVARYGGTIEKFIGDAVMAVWGTPVAHEDDAERAVRAALDLVRGVGEIDPGSGQAAVGEAGGGVSDGDGGPRDQASSSAIRLVARAAVLTGEAAVSLAAEGQGMVAGDLVNTASRVQSVAPAHAVLVDEATRRATEAAIAYEPAGEHALKGKAEPVATWRALRVVAGLGGLGRSVRLEAPFVGRDGDLHLLKELFHATAREHRSRLVTITGIAGIGKSRLAWELKKHLDGLVEPVYWHEGRSPAYGEGLAFWALAEMVRGRARIAETDGPREARRKLAEMATMYLTEPDERARVEPRLAALLGLEAGSIGSAEELTAAWRTLFERVADQGTTVLVFEDLHWADPGLLDFIEGLLAGARSRPILAIALARPELLAARPAWGSTVRSHLRLDLGPLTDEAMDMLLLGLAPGLPSDALRAIRERAEGVPLYAVETVRMLLDQGRLTEANGRFRLVGELGTVAVPGSLTALLGSRLDALDERGRDIVGHAAVLGISFTVASVAAVAGADPEVVRASFDDLVQREVLVFDDAPLSPERGQYAFLQGVLREVAYGRLGRRERAARHAAAARHFASLGSEELAGVVATHWLEAVRATPDDAATPAVRAQAIDALRAAAERARAIGAYASAAGYLADAVDLADGDERLALREARLERLSDAADRAATEAESRALIAVARARADHLLLARAAFFLADALIAGGRPGDAVEILAAIRDEIGVVATEHPDGLRLSAELARCCLMHGEHARAMALIDETLPVVDRLGLRDVVAELLPSRGWALGAQGRILEGVAVLRGGLAFAEREGRFRAEIRSRMNLSAIAGPEEPREAIDVAWEGHVRAQERGFTQWAITLAGNVCEFAFAMGEWGRVADIADRLGIADLIGPWELTPAMYAAMIDAARGRFAEARSEAARLRGLTESLDDPQLQGGIHSMTAWVAFLGGDLDRARDEARHTRDLSRITGAVDDPVGGFVALEQRDAERLRVAAAAPGAGRLQGVILDAFAGGVRVLDGDPGGLTAFDRAADQLLAKGVAFTAALLQRARAMLAPDDADAMAAASRARVTFETLGAISMLRGLPSSLDAHASAEPAATTASRSTGASLAMPPRGT